MLKCARAFLTHRAGTAFEDLHLVSIVDGEVKASQTSSGTPLQVDKSRAIAEAVLNEPGGSLFAIHNHPTNIPPSGAICCYRRGDLPFSARRFDMVVQSNLNKGMIPDDAYEETLRYFEQNYGIRWRRIR